MEDLILIKNAFEDIKKTGYFVTEREDGYMTKYSYDEWKRKGGVSEWDKQIFGQLKKGKVLDLGCGSGKHIEYLEKKGYSTFGIDISEGAIKLAKKNHRNAECIDFWHLEENGGYDNIIIMDSSLGFFVSPKEMDAFFDKAKRLLTEDGQLIVTSINWPDASDATFKAYLSANKDKNRYPGKVKLRNKTENFTGEWFEGYYYDIDFVLKKAVSNHFFPRWIEFYDGIKYAIKLVNNEEDYPLD